ncbi:tripartite tricarboxylate transporter substrate binding protein [Acuticoccus sp. I52.16.1]|uniref:tripartite tricarboxylate transporter substrate binding protein n=1 Tax=Acuticoccus sp. I52.16.1 TaxID=2928472 RepID=UPI001FD54B94|nr:tripartite tricarboxylate transporter substrate binding protein [Acuticoccus sp. I52.16.1]UOM35797.1 tripartite tricarboxylate transporter substrate binding protein [Acuticoccus sp. I52.16.1]
MKKSIALAATLAASVAATSAYAEYPERPITMIVAYSAGGGTDIAARTLVPFIEKELGDGASITVVNRPGAGGEIGFTALAQAKPDGYTIGFINTPNLLSIPIQRKARYDIDSFAPIANIIYDPGAFSLRPDEGISTLDELVAFAKEHPGEVTYGTTGIGSDDHLAALNFERLAGVKFEHIPFSGNADVRAAVIGGHVMMASMNVSETVQDVDDGTLVLLGQMSEERWEGAPDVPTFQEQGYDVIMGSNRGMAAPAGVDAAELQTLSDAVGRAVANPEFRAAAAKQDLALAFQDRESFRTSLERLDSTLQTLWKEEPWVAND